MALPMPSTQFIVEDGDLYQLDEFTSNLGFSVFLLFYVSFQAKYYSDFPAGVHEVHYN